jgi:hypothetical protein
VTRRLTLLAAVLALLAPATASASLAPRDFIGISPQTPLSDEDFALMAEAGVESVRLPLHWSGVEDRFPAYSEPNWFNFDQNVALAAEHGIRIFPFVWGTPAWVASSPNALPVRTSWQRWEWMDFLREAVHRYGPYGSFWYDHPDLPFFPIRRWEIWNEENIVTFAKDPDAKRFAELMRISGRVLHGADPGSQVILGGLFGRPLQSPPNVQSGDFLNSLYRNQPIKRFFDGVALHPYVAAAGAMRAQIENLRRVMRVHHDGATPLYVTELGWGSDSGESRWERGMYGQATELEEAFSLLVGNRRRWRIGGVDWFSWMDQASACQFCDSAGLLTAAREAKPAWYAFNAWTGGDSATVPRLLLLPSE